MLVEVVVVAQGIPKVLSTDLGITSEIRVRFNAIRLKYMDRACCPERSASAYCSFWHHEHVLMMQMFHKHIGFNNARAITRVGPIALASQQITAFSGHPFVCGCQGSRVETSLTAMGDGQRATGKGSPTAPHTARSPEAGIDTCNTRRHPFFAGQKTGRDDAPHTLHTRGFRGAMADAHNLTP